ncbi:MAG TPA: hypothetical protein VGM56_03030 [Byssovorax sp.]|jgi:hypothetical protein
MHLARAAFVSLSLAACGGDVVVATAPSTATSAVASNDAEKPRAAVDIALTSLSKRHFPLEGCTVEQLQLVDQELKAWSQANGSNVCSIVVVHLADGRWEVVVRSGSDPRNPQGRVFLPPAANGVLRIDYAK